jgi:hypothetical protein
MFRVVINIFSNPLKKSLNKTLIQIIYAIVGK